MLVTPFHNASYTVFPGISAVAISVMQCLMALPPSVPPSRTHVNNSASFMVYMDWTNSSLALLCC